MAGKLRTAARLRPFAGPRPHQWQVAAAVARGGGGGVTQWVAVENLHGHQARTPQAKRREWQQAEEAAPEVEREVEEQKRPATEA